MEAPLPFTTHDIETLLAFAQDGYSSWAKALERFPTLTEKSNLHIFAVSTVAATNAGVNVAASISTSKHKQMSDESQQLCWLFYPQSNIFHIGVWTSEDARMKNQLDSVTAFTCKWYHGGYGRGLHVRRTSGTVNLFLCCSWKSGSRFCWISGENQQPQQMQCFSCWMRFLLPLQTIVWRCIKHVWY